MFLTFRLKSLITLLLFPVFVAGFVSGCAQKTSVKDFDSAEEAPWRTNVKKGIKPQADEQVAVIQTVDYGNIVIELYPNVAPKMVERFKKLIQEGFYNGTTFHRVDAELGLIQGGDPMSKDDDPTNDGTGDSLYPNVPGEFSDIPFERGTVGAARKGATPEFAEGGGLTEAQARDTANCQFFITLRPQPQFDEDYAVFGRVIEGISNAEIIMGAPVLEDSPTPADTVVIKAVTLEPRSKYVSKLS